MKKTLCFALCLLTLLFCGCEKQEEPDAAETGQSGGEPVKQITVTFVNELEEADVWILPQTEANMKTTLWGTATAAKVKTGESRAVKIPEAGDAECYMFRMIDVDEIYHAADGVVLNDGWTLTIKGEDFYSLIVEVTDESGAVQATYSVFAASL